MTVFADNALEGKHILITGATGGIGAETAKQAAQCGAKLSLTGRNQEKLDALIEDLPDGTEAAAIIADITKKGDRIRIAEKAEEKLGPVDGLVNAAAIADHKPLTALKEQELEDMMQLNHTATVMLTKLIFERMADRKAGEIVNVASLSGLRGTYGNTAYASSKFALIGFTQSLALEAIQSNIRVNAVCPGYVDTEMADQQFARKAEAAGISQAEAKHQAAEAIPSGRISSPQEVASTILFLLTGAVPNMVGESIKISGGSVL